jgi:phosphoribosylanthranilate isomerase
VQRFKDYKVIKALRIRRKRDLRNILRYKPFAFLFDTYSRLKIGGTGERFNWELVRHIDGINRPVFLAGGLTYKNAKEAIETAHPDWLDVSSSVEMSPGKKDPEKVRKFIEAAKQK